MPFPNILRPIRRPQPAQQPADDATARVMAVQAAVDYAVLEGMQAEAKILRTSSEPESAADKAGFEAALAEAEAEREHGSLQGTPWNVLKKQVAEAWRHREDLAESA